MFIIGIRFGAMSHQYADAPFKLGMLVYELEELNEGFPDSKFKNIKEIELNQLIWYSDIYLNTYHRYFWPNCDIERVTNNLKRAAAYRRQNPYNMECGAPELCQHVREINQAVSKYKNLF